MKVIAKIITLLLCLGTWTVAFPQTPPEADQATGTEAGEQALPCIPAGDTLQAPAGESGQLEGQQVVGDAAVPCEEPVTEADSGEEQVPGKELRGSTADAGPDTGESPDVDASADEIFTPVDEISEDYPVPLPADI